MRMITATTAFKMPFSGICLSQSTVSKILTEASLYPTEIFPVINSKKFQVFKLFCCINSNWHGADCTKHITERYAK